MPFTPVQVAELLDGIGGANGEKVADERSLVTALQTAARKVRGEMQHLAGKVALSQFSQWLTDFDPSQCALEVKMLYWLMS
jgi:hypothetical protein